jgi:ribosomal protein L12E/L44/L45/RPP1/RPP2
VCVFLSENHLQEKEEVHLLLFFPRPSCAAGSNVSTSGLRAAEGEEEEWEEEDDNDEEEEVEDGGVRGVESESESSIC